MVNMNKKQFFTMAWTWGIVMTLIGYIVGAVMLITGHRAKKIGYCWYFTLKDFDGINLGNVIITGEGASGYIKKHEHGHAFQNAIYGPGMIIISLCSVVRAGYRKFRNRINKPCKSGYYDIWFEKQASEWGHKFGINHNIDWD